jgi:hypothetical protein
MIFYGLQYALLQSRIIGYSMNFKLTMYINGDHDCYSFDVPSLQSSKIINVGMPNLALLGSISNTKVHNQYIFTVLQLFYESYTC